MAKIYLKGIQKPITVPRSLAKQVDDFWSDSSILPNERFKHHSFNIEKREIKSIIHEDFEDNTSESNDVKKEENEKFYREENEKYEKNIEILCNKSVTEKANNTKIASLLYETFTGNKPTAEFIQSVIKHQTEYFQKNPRHPYAKINYGKLLSEPQLCDSLTLKSSGPKVILSKMYEVIITGIQTANKKRLL